MTTLGTRLGRAAHFLVIALMAWVGLLALAGLVIALAPDGWFDGVFIHFRRGSGGTIMTSDTRLSIAATCLLIAVVIAAVAWPLLGIVRSAAHGTPFVARNVNRLYQLAGVFAVLTFGNFLIAAMFDALPPIARLLFGVGTPQLHPRFSPAIMALILAVLAEVFREGVRLREDAEGTI